MEESEIIEPLDTEGAAASDEPSALPREDQRRNTEALILASPEPISAARVARLIPGCNAAAVRVFVGELNGEYFEQGRAFEICDVGGGYQIRTLPEFATTLAKIQINRPLRLSQAALETLAIVAYRQPVTRAEVENVRGVDAGAVTRSLLERNLIRIAGHREVAGRPMLFATTRRFLEIFGLPSLDDLPTLRDFEELSPRSDADGSEVDDSDADGADFEGSDSDEAAGSALVFEAEAEGDLDRPGLEAAGGEASEADSVDDVLAAFVDAKPVGEPH